MLLRHIRCKKSNSLFSVAIIQILGQIWFQFFWKARPGSCPRQTCFATQFAVLSGSQINTDVPYRFFCPSQRVSDPKLESLKYKITRTQKPVSWESSDTVPKYIQIFVFYYITLFMNHDHKEQVLIPFGKHLLVLIPLSRVIKWNDILLWHEEQTWINDKHNHANPWGFFLSA